MNPAKNPKITTQEKGKTREGRITSDSLLVKPLMETLWSPGSSLIGVLQTGMLIETSHWCLLLSRMRALLCLLGGLTGLPLPGSQEVVPDQIYLLLPHASGPCQRIPATTVQTLGGDGKTTDIISHSLSNTSSLFQSQFPDKHFFACLSLYLKPTLTNAVGFV